MPLLCSALGRGGCGVGREIGPRNESEGTRQQVALLAALVQRRFFFSSCPSARWVEAHRVKRSRQHPFTRCGAENKTAGVSMFIPLEMYS